jgi:chromate transporter
MKPATTPKHPDTSLKELALLFLKLGTIAFGGPAAHIGMMEEEIVHRRKWMTRERFLDLLGAANLIPGPNSTELAIHIGHSQGGWPGLLVAGVSFILPAALIVTAFAWAYTRFGKLPATAAVLYGVKPVIIAIVLQALWRLTRTAVKSMFLAFVGIVALPLTIIGVHELLVLLGAGLLSAGYFCIRHRTRIAFDKRRPALAPAGFAAFFAATAPVAFGLWPLFLFFLKVGSVLFGSGYVLLAFLRSDLVERWGWLTNNQLLDAVAVGQVTPGPVFTTATFIGYILAGGKGAVVATVGIFLPGFVFVALSGPLVPRLRSSATAAAFLDGVIVGSLALMTLVTYQLGRSALTDVFTVATFVVSVLALMRYNINSVWLIVGGALVGLAVRI